ncbi:hypothetical protein AGMMS49975_02710 [Clostridia bacterium]|nr:hypothetical protein AGMMS49975_02710 [Clostridia bacterium]
MSDDTALTDEHLSVCDGAEGGATSVWQPTLPVGNYGIRVVAYTTPDDYTQELFNTVSYRIGGDFYKDAQGKESRPIIPIRPDTYDVVAPLYKMIEGNDNPLFGFGKSRRVQYILP